MLPYPSLKPASLPQTLDPCVQPQPSPGPEPPFINQIWVLHTQPQAGGLILPVIRTVSSEETTFLGTF